jgi:hypothetical protein
VLVERRLAECAAGWLAILFCMLDMPAGNSPNHHVEVTQAELE